MKKILLSIACAVVTCSAMAQTANQPTPPNTGNFFVTVNKGQGPEGVLVGYTLSPERLINNVNLYLVAWEPMQLSAKIFTINSELVASWMPEQKKKEYNYNFDISNFPAGNYKMEIYGPDNKLVRTVNFQKQSN